MLTRREQIVRQLIANDLRDLVDDVRAQTYDALVALLTNGFPGYANMSDEELENLWLLEGFGELS